MNDFEKAIEKHFGSDNLRKIQSITVGIVGAGGLGSNVANHLVRCGFCKFVIADFDKVESSNLNRQFFFFNQIGQFKVDAIYDNLIKINKDINVETVRDIITEHNICNIFKDCNVLIEAVDKAEVKPIIIEGAAKMNIFCVSASGMAGYGQSDNMVCRKVNDMLVIVGDMKSGVSDKSPPLSPRVGIAAAKEADVVLEYVLENN